MELGQIKIDLDKLLDKKHEDSDNLIDFEVDLEYDNGTVCFVLDSEKIDNYKKVSIIGAFIQFSDFETNISRNYINEIEKYLNL